MIERPTEKWKELIGEMDAYTDESVREGEQLLIAFETNLARVAKGDQAAILAEVKSLILKLNDLNDKYEGGLIETDEREDLWEYITAQARAAGLSIADGEDITEEWRDW